MKKSAGVVVTSADFFCCRHYPSHTFTAKPPLKKYVFVQCPFGGAEGNRTPVRKQLGKNFSGRSLLFAFPLPGGNKHPTGIGSFMMRGMGKAYHTHVLRLNHTRARVSGTPGADGRLIRQPGQQCCCQLNLRNCPFYRGQAPRPAIPASLPPSKPVRPHGRLQNTVGILQRIAVLY